MGLGEKRQDSFFSVLLASSILVLGSWGMLGTATASNEATSDPVRAAQTELNSLLEKSVSSLKQAPSLVEFGFFGIQFEQVLEKEIALQTEFGPQVDICQSLMRLESADLALLEHELEEHFDRISPCFEALQASIEAHWDFERFELAMFEAPHSPLTASGAGFRFNTITKRVDSVAGPSYTRGPVERGEVILTFDDGPHRTLTPRILQSLRQAGAKGIFFPLGRSVRNSPSVLRQVAADGHVVGSHSYSHPNLARLAHSRAVNEIRAGHRAVADAIGHVAPFFRFPYGGRNQALRNYLRQNQTADFFWNIDTRDWNTSSATALVNRTIRLTESQGGGIILFHDIQRVTAEALPSILRELHRRGYTPVILVPQDERAFRVGHHPLLR